MADLQPNLDPLNDPEPMELVAPRLLKGYDDPWEVLAPHEFDFLAATERFLRFAHALTQQFGEGCDLEVWPTLQDAAFHGEVQLPQAALNWPTFAAVRASNFGNLITVVDDDTAVKPEALATIRSLGDRHRYRYLPSAPLHRRYDGYHQGKTAMRTWKQRFFGYA